MQRNSRGFSIAEVLLSLGLAALVIGVVLQSASRDAVSVSRAPADYQALLRASQVLEYRMEEDRKSDDATGSAGEKFPYDLSVKPVVTDARVEEVVVAVASASRKRETVSAYRLKVRREKSKAADASPSPSPSASASASPNSGASPASNTSASPATSAPPAAAPASSGSSSSGGAAAPTSTQ